MSFGRLPLEQRKFRRETGAKVQNIPYLRLMKSRWILLFPVVLLGFSRCVLEEASEPEKKSLNIVADHLSHEDSATIEQFSKKYHVDIKLEVLKADAILKRVRADRYNADFDVLITEEETLRKQLQELKAFRAIRNTNPFGQLERQFNNQHHYWLPVSHNPLVVTRYKDTAGCSSIDFKAWHKNDSLKPIIQIQHQRDQYLSLIKASTNMNRLQAPNRKLSSESVYSLSELVELENRSDSLRRSNANSCRYFLIDNKRYVSTVNTISIYRHGRNSENAQQFLNWFSGNAYAIANGRNHLPTRKNIQPNWYILSLFIQ